MKNILVPVDFSSTSENAVRYAVGLAKHTKAGITLLHAYHVPVPVSETPMAIPMEEIEQASNEALAKIERQIKTFDSGIEIKLITKAGFAVDCILDQIENKETDLVVMGIKGHTNAFDVAIGSNSTTLLKQTKCPVLVIPDGAEFKTPQNIVLGCDYSKDVSQNVIDSIKFFGKLFNAKVYILDVFGAKEKADQNKFKDNLKLHSALSDLNVVIHYREGDDVNAELAKYVDRHNADWLIMIPHTRSPIASLFHRSNTKQMVFHTHIPLLSLHD